MARLPVPGSDDNIWGLILNEYLSVAHREDGKIRGSAPVVNIADFGAIGDGVTDDTEAIQTAINSVKGSAQVPPFTTLGTVFFPKGDYLLSAPLQTFSGIHLRGEDYGANLVASNNFSGSGLITLEGLSKYYTVASISRLSFTSSAGTGIAAIQANAEVVGSCYFRDLHFYSANGLMLNTYTQYVVVINIYSVGPADTILHLRGNFNIVRRVDKEAGGTGQSNAPYLLLDGHGGGASTGNHLEHILIEGITSPNKSALVLDNAAATTIHNFWNEPTDTNGFAIQLLNCRVSTDITGIVKHILDDNRIRIVNSTGVTIEHLSTDGQDISIQRGIEIDDLSTVTVKQAYSRRGSNLYPLNQLGKSLHIQEHINRSILTEDAPGYLPRSRPIDASPHNLFYNPSFESGLYKWEILQPEPALNFVTSEVGSGQMLQLIWPAGSQISYLYQTIDIPPEWIGQSLTLTGLVRLDRPETFVSPFIEGAGLLKANGFQRVTGDGNWHLLTQSFTLLDSGTLSIGLFFVMSGNALTAYVDEMSVSFGTEALRGTSKFQSIGLGQKTMLNGTQAPSTGQWQQGDIIWNTEPDVQNDGVSQYVILGWVCTSSGSPGIWNTLKTDVLN